MAGRSRTHYRSTSARLNVVLLILVYILMIAITVWGSLATSPYLKYYNWE